MEERSVDRLANYIIKGVGVLLVLAFCWYFRTMISYILLAAVMSMVGHPFFKLLKKPQIKGYRIPDAVASALSIVFILMVLVGIVKLIFPVISSISKDISKANLDNMAQAISQPLAVINQSLINTFPKLGYGFRIESVVLDQVQDLLNVSIFSSMVGSVASTLASVGVGLFAMIFISFFFIKKPGMFSSIIMAFVPDKYEGKMGESLSEIGTLISRYFVGLVFEVLGVSILNFLGLLLVARMGFGYSIGIAFLTGILNVVPYVGPLIGGVVGIVLSLTIKYVCASSLGLAVSFPVFLLVLVCVFVFTQLVDNYLYQPFIYSNSIKAHPLEIFMVLLAAGHIGGILGMLIAIPSYTVIRVIAIKFFGDVKAIQMLTGNSE